MQDFSPTADIENEIKTVISDDNFSGENGEILGLKNPKKVRGELVASEGSSRALVRVCANGVHPPTKVASEGSSRALVSQDAVLLGLLEEARHTGDGSSHSARVAAWAHIGKHLGMFIDRVHATGQQAHGITHIQLVAPNLDEHGRAKKAAKDMTDEELAVELAKLGEYPSTIN